MAKIGPKEQQHRELREARALRLAVKPAPAKPKKKRRSAK